MCVDADSGHQNTYEINLVTAIQKLLNQTNKNTHYLEPLLDIINRCGFGSNQYGERVADLIYQKVQQLNPIGFLKLICNENTPAYILQKIVNPTTRDFCNETQLYINNNTALIQRYIAENKNTPSETLATLYKSKFIRVRCGVARNPNTPKAILEVLSTDNKGIVQYCVARNSNTPLAILAETIGNCAKIKYQDTCITWDRSEYKHTRRYFSKARSYR